MFELAQQLEHGWSTRASEWFRAGSRTVTNDDIARAILDAGIYVVIATADANGMPWVSPVWFAKEDYQELYWVSYPAARHSQNIAVRPQIAMVVFD
jgi:nitroimidazol reductase NimA-like FMN-containing flavoprotein (pyridoxamine 5'-phosphate oxidase superfamily)